MCITHASVVASVQLWKGALDRDTFLVGMQSLWMWSAYVLCTVTRASTFGASCARKEFALGRNSLCVVLCLFLVTAGWPHAAARNTIFVYLLMSMYLIYPASSLQALKQKVERCRCLVCFSVQGPSICYVLVSSDKVIGNKK